jgi:hypothetical protein
VASVNSFTQEEAPRPTKAGAPSAHTRLTPSYTMTLAPTPSVSTSQAEQRSVPLYSVHPAQQAAFAALTAKHLPGTRTSTIRQLADAYAALHGLFNRSPQRTSRRGREGDWLRISMHQLADAMGATYATAKRRIHQLDQLDLITYTRLGYAANDWFLSVTDLPNQSPKSLALQPRAQNELHMERKMSSPSYVFQKKTTHRGGEVSTKTNSPQHKQQLPAELLSDADLAFNTLKTNGMRRDRLSFDRVIASAPPEFTTSQIRQALVNLQSTSLETITPDLWTKQLKATLRPGPALLPYFRDDVKPRGNGTPPSASQPNQEQPQPLSMAAPLEQSSQAETHKTQSVPVHVDGEPGWLAPAGIYGRGSGTLLLDPQGIPRYIPTNRISGPLQGHTEPSQSVPQPELVAA